MDVRFLFVVGYLLLMVGVSLYLKRKMVKSSDDFAVAGRRLPMIVLVGTLLATWCGGGGISGSAGLVYKNGPLFGILLFAGAPIGMIVLYFISGAVRKSTTYTIPELFELRYGAAARNLAAICIILAYIGTTASQFKAAGNIFMITSGIDFITSTVICVVFMALLALIGGMVIYGCFICFYDGVWLPVRHFISERRFRWLWRRTGSGSRREKFHLWNYEYCSGAGLCAANAVFGAG